MKRRELSLKFIDNARWLAKEKYISVGDIEKNCGLFGGYIAKKEKQGVVSIDVASEIAEYLGVDIDTILHLEDYLAKEVEK